MRTILAVSKDEYLARSNQDKMLWLGPVDKAIFKAITLTGSNLIGVSTVTYKLMPILEGRPVTQISTKAGYYSLETFNAEFPNAWLIGGPTIIEQAISHNYLDEIILCKSDRFAFPETGKGLRDTFSPYLERQNWFCFKSIFPGVVVEHWRK